MSQTINVSVSVKASGRSRVRVTVNIPPAPGPKRTPLAVLADAERDDVGGLSEPDKMPWLSWSTPAERCKTGSRLREVPGSVCEGCYARKGNYSWPNVRAAMERRFARLADLRGWSAGMARALTERASRFVPTASDPWPAFRWHDSGDLQSADHLRAVCEVAALTQRVTLADGSAADVRHWLPTREYGFVREYLASGGEVPRNLAVRLSAHRKDGPPPSGYGLPVSTVHTRPGVYPEAAACPAYDQGGRCLSCRSCWDQRVEHVSYPAH